MKIDELYSLWEKDCNIDRTELGEESLKIPQLHHKYFKLFSQERLVQRALENDLKEMLRAKHEYYQGTMSEEELNEKGWEPQQLRILRTDLPLYLESDKDLQSIKMKIHFQQEKIDFLESVIKSLQNRGFQIKAAIEWTKFQMGA
jgi:hypothetical protein